ncbi:MAG TPA: hypothetical protein VFR91_00465 [Dyella sp.]|nr:hypothetical protein [Dyella sp.]
MTPHRSTALALAAVLALAGCANQPHRSQATRPARTAHAPAAAPHEPVLPARTGIAACDDYLASYRACHRAAGIFAPNQIEPRYREMRHTLLRDSLDPDIRPQLATRCTALARSLRQALHGRSCGAVPAPAASETSGDASS